MSEHSDDALNDAEDMLYYCLSHEINGNVENLFIEDGYEEDYINNILSDSRESAEEIFGHSNVNLDDRYYENTEYILDKCQIDIMNSGSTKSNFDKMYDRYQKMPLHVKKPPICKMPSNCTICGSPMKEVKGKFGVFAGCSNWPHCKQVGHSIIK